MITNIVTAAIVDTAFLAGRVIGAFCRGLTTKHYCECREE